MKRRRYWTMSSWNKSSAPAYNLKIYNVISPHALRDKVYALLGADEFHVKLGDLISDFGFEHDYKWQAGMNGRSGGYLVLYRGDREPSGYQSYCTACNQKSYEKVAGDVGRCGACGANQRKNFETTCMRVFTRPGQSIDEREVPGDVLRSFRRLALDIISMTKTMAKETEVVDEEYQVTETRKVLKAI